MKSLNNIVGVFTIILLLITATTSSQTVLDTASVIMGTGIRGLPNPKPVEPKSLESNSTTLIIPKRESTNKQETQMSEYMSQNIENPNYSDTMLKNAYRNSLLAYYRSVEKQNTANAVTFDSVTSYYSWALKNRQSIITRQQTTGTIIFVLVVILVLSGLLFSAIQFFIAFKSAKRKGTLPDTSIKASLSGVEVSSSILGVIILTISIVFFYLYLTKVYPLVSLDQVTTQAPR